MKKAIENIGKWAIEQLFDIQNHEYEYEGACYEPENNLYEPAKASVSFYAEYKGHDVSLYVSYGSDKIVEVFFDEDNRDNINDALEKYMNDNFDFKEFFSLIQDDVRENSMDEWQSHGFADEADYLRYRYA